MNINKICIKREKEIASNSSEFTPNNLSSTCVNIEDSNKTVESIMVKNQKKIKGLVPEIITLYPILDIL